MTYRIVTQQLPNYYNKEFNQDLLTQFEFNFFVEQKLVTDEKIFNKRLVIILGFLFSMLVFLSAIFIYVYKNILISNNKPKVNLRVFNKDDENIELQPEQKFVLDPRKLRTKINYVYSEYYFDNIRFHYYFLKCWIPQMMFFYHPTSYRSFYYSNEKISYSKTIILYHYHNEQQLYQAWKLTLESLH